MFYSWTICHLPLLFWYVRVEKKLFFKFQILKFRVWLPLFSDRNLTRPVVQNSSMRPSMRKEKSWKTKSKLKRQSRKYFFVVLLKTSSVSPRETVISKATLTNQSCDSHAMQRHSQWHSRNRSIFTTPTNISLFCHLPTIVLYLSPNINIKSDVTDSDCGISQYLCPQDTDTTITTTHQRRRAKKSALSLDLVYAPFAREHWDYNRLILFSILSILYDIYCI